MSRQIGIRFTLISLLIISHFLAGLCKAQDNSPDPANSISSAGHQKKSVNLANLSLEELMNIETKVSSASRQSLAQAPAAVFVITAEDIRRGGFSSIAEALRTVPGLYVATINRHWWTVSARGFSDYVNTRCWCLLTDEACTRRSLAASIGTRRIFRWKTSRRLRSSAARAERCGARMR